MQVGFVGVTGLMGHGMARNILGAGLPLSFTLRSPSDRVADLVESGAAQVADNAALGSDCDVVVVCVTAAPDVEEVVAGLLAAPKEGLVIVDTSTSEPVVTRRLAELCAQQGVRFVDAPVTRGPAEAEAGTLNVMVGADDDTFAAVRPVIETIGERIVRTGSTGTAHTLKLLNNFVIQAITTSLAEAFAVAAATGVDPRLVERILSMGVAESALLHLMGRALAGDHSGMVFALDNARKDVRYYTRLAGDNSIPVPVGDAVHESLGIASALGFGAQYVPALVDAHAALNRIQIADPPRG